MPIAPHPIMTWPTPHRSVPSFLIAALLVPMAAVPSVATEPHESILSNGMKVLLVEVPKAPVATVQVWYKVGSRNEVMGRAGLSHMLEHMMFKGTAKYPKGAFSRIIRKNGGIDNAFTSQDFTAYFENLAADRVELALELEADRMQGLILDEGEFRTEREVVKEERRLRTEDDPQGALVEALFAQAFLSHPYHWPVIGWFTSGYGTRKDPFNGSPDFHAGLDISADRGTPVWATADGTVESAGYNGNYGNSVLVTHGYGISTRFGHLSRYAVSAGQKVRRGQVIGYVGATGRATSSHLHYEILINGQPAASLGGEGRVVTRRITRENYRTFLPPSDEQG